MFRLEGDISDYQGIVPTSGDLLKGKTGHELSEGLQKRTFEKMDGDILNKRIGILSKKIRENQSLSMKARSILNHIIVNESAKPTIALYCKQDEKDTFDEGYQIYKKLISAYRKLTMILKSETLMKQLESSLERHVVMPSDKSGRPIADSIDTLIEALDAVLPEQSYSKLRYH